MEVCVHLHAPATQPPIKKALLSTDTHCTWGWLGSKCSQDVLERWKSPALPGLDPWFLGSPEYGFVIEYAILAATSEKYGSG